MPATLNGLYGDNLFNALVALRLPAVAQENVHLEVALATQCLAQQDTIDIITHVYAQIIHKDYYMQEEDDRTLAFLDVRMSLMDPYVFLSFCQIHVVVYDTTVIILPFASTS